IIHDGFVPQINDSLDVEFGVDVGIVPSSSRGGAVYFTPWAGPRYTVYLLPKLAAYVMPEFGIRVWPNNFGYSVVDFHIDFALGAIYKITDTFYVRADIGYYTLRAGLGIAF